MPAEPYSVKVNCLGVLGFRVLGMWAVVLSFYVSDPGREEGHQEEVGGGAVRSGLGRQCLHVEGRELLPKLSGAKP